MVQALLALPLVAAKPIVHAHRGHEKPFEAAAAADYLKARMKPHLPPTVAGIHSLATALKHVTAQPTAQSTVHPAVAAKPKRAHHRPPPRTPANASKASPVEPPMALDEGREMSPPMEPWESIDDDVDAGADLRVWAAEEDQVHKRSAEVQKTRESDDEKELDPEETEVLRYELDPGRYGRNRPSALVPQHAAYRPHQASAAPKKE